MADDTLTAAKNVKLKTLIDRGIGQLDYTYDMGDNWHHTVKSPRNPSIITLPATVPRSVRGVASRCLPTASTAALVSG